jgi:hypothetical protein
MTITKEALEKRKEELTKDFTSLEERITTGVKALESMKANLNVLSGAIQQCDFFLNMEKKDVKDK